jgi:hypothetical protein
MARREVLLSACGIHGGWWSTGGGNVLVAFELAVVVAGMVALAVAFGLAAVVAGMVAIGVAVGVAMGVAVLSAGVVAGVAGGVGAAGVKCDSVTSRYALSAA